LKSSAGRLVHGGFAAAAAADAQSLTPAGRRERIRVHRINGDVTLL
jgi:hypothetical protein